MLRWRTLADSRRRWENNKRNSVGTRKNWASKWKPFALMYPPIWHSGCKRWKRKLRHLEDRPTWTNSATSRANLAICKANWARCRARPVKHRAGWDNSRGRWARNRENSDTAKGNWVENKEGLHMRRHAKCRTLSARLSPTVQRKEWTKPMR